MTWGQVFAGRFNGGEPVKVGGMRAVLVHPKLWAGPLPAREVKS